MERRNARNGSLLVGIALVVAFVAPASGAITTANVGAGNLAVSYEGNFFFPQVKFTGPGTHSNVTLTGSLLDTTVTYLAGDLDFIGAYGSGFRWAETIQNNSSGSWDVLRISLIDTSATFSKQGNFLYTGIGTAEVPGFAMFAGANPMTVTVLSNVGTPSFGNTMYLSGDKKTISVVFGTPLASGGSITVHIPIVNLGAGGGSFKLQHQALPEPLSATVWLGLAALGGALGWRRCRRNRGIPSAC